MFEQNYVMRLIKEMVRAIINLLFHIDTDSPSAELLEKAGDKKNLEIAILFYSYLNDRSDDFLEEHKFSRDEVRAGLVDIMSKFGIDGFSEVFLQ